MSLTPKERSDLQELIDSLQNSNGAASGQTITTPSGGTQLPSGWLQAGSAGGMLTQQQISTLLGAFTQSLTATETQELEQLKKERELAIKAAKLAIFKKLDSTLRQTVINLMAWTDSCKEMDTVTVDKPARLVELEQKEQFGRIFIQPMNHSKYTFPAWVPQLPEGVTIDDLRQAHIEASLEEELLNE